jgi:hypothetical protein
MASVSEYPALENAFNVLSANSDIKQDRKADAILATMFIEANGIVDKASGCRIDGALVSLGAFDLFRTALMKRKYSTSQEKPCRWTSKETEEQIAHLAHTMRESLITAMEMNCSLQSR